MLLALYFTTFARSLAHTHTHLQANAHALRYLTLFVHDVCVCVRLYSLFFHVLNVMLCFSLFAFWSIIRYMKNVDPWIDWPQREKKKFAQMKTCECGIQAVSFGFHHLFLFRSLDFKKWKSKCFCCVVAIVSISIICVMWARCMKSACFTLYLSLLLILIVWPCYIQSMHLSIYLALGLYVWNERKRAIEGKVRLSVCVCMRKATETIRAGVWLHVINMGKY